jgi:cytochrome P450
MHFEVLAWAAAVALVARILFPFLKGVSSPLRNVPGPTGARFTDLWYLWRVRRGRFEHDNIELHRKHGEFDFLVTIPDVSCDHLSIDAHTHTLATGNIVRYGPNRYSFSSPEAQKTIYGHGARFPKSSWYATWQNPSPSQWSLFADQSIPRHSENRRQYQSAYTMSSLVSYESYVDECADLFSQRLQEVASAGAYADMGHWLQCYAFDVIGLITYSKRLGFLDRGDDIRGVIAALEDHLWYATFTGIFSWLHKYLFPVRNWLAGPTGTGRAYVMKFTQERIAEHEKQQTRAIPVDGIEEGKASMDFLSKFFKKNADDPKSFTMYHLSMGCVSNMVAGSDTTAISLSAILYYLLKVPHTFEALRQEIDERQHQGRIGHYITFKESQEMPYLQAVMKEALRMHPATGLPLERVVPAGGASICDQFFPEGVSSRACQIAILVLTAWVDDCRNQLLGCSPRHVSFRP